MGIYDEFKIAEAVELPENQTVSAVIAMGRPAKAAQPPTRLEVSDLLRVK